MKAPAALPVPDVTDHQCIPAPGDALVVVDVQNDFLPGGALAVSGGDAILPVLNRYITAFAQRGLPIFLTRDWHPPNHCSFREEGGPWPAHCIAETYGAAQPRALRVPATVAIISKATRREGESYSGFTPELEHRLRADGVRRVWVGGLATDYCVFHTVRDALARGFAVCLLRDAIRPVEVLPGDGRRAEDEMLAHGACAVTLDEVAV